MKKTLFLALFLLPLSLPAQIINPASGLVIKCIPTPIAHTGDTGFDVVSACKIPANTLAIGSVFEVSSAVVTGSANTGTVATNICFGTTSSACAAGVNLSFISSQSANTTGTNMGFCTVQSAALLNCSGLSFSTATYRLGLNQAQAAITAVNITSDFYIIFAMQNSVAADTATAQQMFIRITP
jgi:hypothetical protein